MNSRPIRIYLNGFMGSGKSTVGPLLASKLGWSFVDLDDRIISTIEMPISRYFKEAGEAAFRVVEKEELVSTMELQKYVVAVGGGALCNQHNLDWALQHGIVVYLEIPTEALIKRLKDEFVTRPMLRGEDGQMLDDFSLSQRISGLLETRRPFYEQSHLIINTKGKSAGITAKKIVEELKAHASKVV